jgi:excinuclease ABC subunit B
MSGFKLKSEFGPKGDQPQAIEKLIRGINREKKYQTLLGVTGSGKTFTMANVIARLNKPTLIISHNKTLAAQLYNEFKQFFPENAVEYFISYYDYYQPEAYIPRTDTYIEKDSSINDQIDRLRLSATSSLMTRRDCVIVASVSCIYNLGSPADYREMLVELKRGQSADMQGVIKGLVDIQYERNDIDFSRGKFRVRGDVMDIFPAYRTSFYRVEFFGDKIERISELDAVTAKRITELENIGIYPAKHFVIADDVVKKALVSIEEEMIERVRFLKDRNKLLEAQRLESRTRFDMEMLSEVGYCSGVENYSRHLSGRPPGSRPYCLIDYFPGDFLTIIDESHVTLPQVRGMYNGDRSRKETLVEYGFRLPSCLDNRPLRFDEFESLTKTAVFTSATPGEYEAEKSEGVLVEQVIRPTGLVDPPIEVRPTQNQIDDLVGEISKRARKKERSLVTTLTKRMSEDLCDYLKKIGIKVRYLHSEIDALERVKILKELRQRNFDCLVGVNLLREGLDLPEVSLVAVLDADKEGFLRSQTSLIQVAGRAARNVNGTVIMYADEITRSMKNSISETERRRKKQLEFNREHNITPVSIKKAIHDGVEIYQKAEETVLEAAGETEGEHDLNTVISYLEREMELAARNLQFERAAEYRDKIYKLKNNFGRKRRR